MAARIKEEDQEDSFDSWLESNFNNYAVKTECHTVKTEEGEQYGLLKGETENTDFGLAKGNVTELLEKKDRKRNLDDNRETSSLDNGNENSSAKTTKGPADILNTNEKWESILRKAPLSGQAGSFCKFKCFACNIIYSSHRTMQVHLWKNPDHKSNKPIRAHLVSAVGHKCQLCGKKVLNDQAFLGRHMKFTHKISLPVYIKRFDCKKIPILSAEAQKIQAIVDDAPLSENLGSLCKFKCLPCGKMWSTSDTLRIHLRKTSHGMFRPLSAHLVKAVSYKCGLCKEKFLCDIHIVSSHVKSRHKISYFEYKSKFCQNTDFEKKIASAPRSKEIANLCTFKCLLCKEGPFDASKRLQAHLKNSHNQVSRLLRQEIQSHLVNIVGHTCKICLRVILCDALILATHLHGMHKTSVDEYRKTFHCPKDAVKLKIPAEFLEQAQLSEVVGGLCKFKCLSCPAKFHSISGLRHHLTVQQPSHAQIRLLLDHVTKMVVHKCKLCETLILCESSFIYNHFKTCHDSMSVGTYCKQMKCTRSRRGILKAQEEAT
jgi:hypothetical protein